MSDGSFELQTSLFNTLGALQPSLVAGGIHAPAPQDTPLPYVEVGESDAVAADVQARDGLTETITIHVWTVPGSFAPAKQIMSRIRDALHGQKLTVSGRSAALANVLNTRVFADDDAESVHGVVTLSVNHFGQKET